MQTHPEHDRQAAKAQSSCPVFPMPRVDGCPLALSPDIAVARRAQGPVRAVTWSGDEVWLVTRYDQSREILRDTRFSSDESKQGFPGHTAASRQMTRGFLSLLDPPEHSNLRRIVMPEFTAKRMEALRPQVQAAVDVLIDGMLTGPQPVDLVRCFALQVPTMVICAMMGVPYEDRALFHDAVAVCFDGATTREEALVANGKFKAYMDELVARKVRDGSDDVLGRLGAFVHSGDITEEDLAGLARLLVIAGFDTTGNTIGLGTILLLEHPDQLDELKADPGLTANAVEEILRYTSVTHNGRRRVATADAHIADRTIRAGDGIVVAQDAANRDEEAFPNPEMFHIHRKARHHVSFGFGPHACAGSSLARLELEVVFSTLWRRLPGLRLAVGIGDLEFKHDSQIYGVEALPVCW